MLGSSQPVAFIPSTDLDRSRRFYEGVLGLRVRSQDAFAVVVDAAGLTVRITKVGATFKPQPFTVFGWHLDDLHGTIARLAEAGVELRRVEGLEQDESGVWAAPGGSRVAWFMDPDGNTLSVHHG
jgi:catechol 2,3-dioxygenase-like lactoylglutathione lyase family enzyme